MTTIKTTNLSEFIRSQPLETSVAEVVALAKAQKLKVTSGLVYGVRRAMKIKNGEAVPTKKTSGMSLNEKATRAEVLFVAFAAEIGLSRALQLLTAQRETVLDLMEGKKR